MKTLQQKFEVVEPNHKNYLEGLEEVADEFTINFSKWCVKNKIELTGSIPQGNLHYLKPNNWLMEELLEIYKREKGLKTE